MLKAVAGVEGVRVWAGLAQRSLRLVSGRSSVRFESAHIRFLFLFKISWCLVSLPFTMPN